MSSPSQAVTILEHSHVGPPPSTTTTTTLPFTLFDCFWVRLPNINRLTFYEFPYSESHFIENVIPNLKNSLSQALKEYCILAGKLVVPEDTSMFPEIRYVEGDAVSLLFARVDYSVDYFNKLVANEPRNCAEFYPFVPQIVMEPQDSSSSSEASDESTSSSSKVIKLLSLQVTLFPNVGICIGVTNHHAVGDANAIFRFVKSWATLAKDGAATLSGELLPLYDRTLVQDPKNIKKHWWNLVGTMDFGDAFSKLLPATTHKERVTVVFDSETVKNLKSYAMSKNPALERLSTFIVVCAYVWISIVKSRVATEENVNEEEAEYFGFVADVRERLDPPLPDNYFGNCLVYCFSPSKVKDLTEEGGFVLAVELIKECIKKRLFNKDGVLSDAENWFKGFAKVDINRMIGVAGSPKYNYYDLDFGFGKGRKFEFVSIDEQGSIAVSGCRDGGGVIEVGLSLPKERMNAFVASFNEGLKGLHL